LVVGVVVLPDLALAGLLEALDRLRRDVVVPVVQMEFVLGEKRGRGQREHERGGGEPQKLLHDRPSWERRRVGETREAMMISASVSSINRLETAFTSGVTA